MAQSASQSRRNGAVKIIKPANAPAAPEAGAVPIAEQKPAPRSVPPIIGADAIKAMGAHRPPERTGKAAPRVKAGNRSVAWPESLREAARVIGFRLTDRTIPAGILPEVEEWKLAEPVPTEARRAKGGALLLSEFINGTYNGNNIGGNMRAGESAYLETLLSIFYYNPELYGNTKSYHSLSKLLDRLASAAGRYVILTEDGLLSLTEIKPQTKAAE